MEFEDDPGSQKCMIFFCFLAKSWPDHFLVVDLCFGNVPNGIWVPLHIARVCKNVFWPRFGQKTPNSNFGNCFYRHVWKKSIFSSSKFGLKSENHKFYKEFVLESSDCFARRYFAIVPPNPLRKYIPTFTSHMYTWLWNFKKYQRQVYMWEVKVGINFLGGWRDYRKVSSNKTTTWFKHEFFVKFAIFNF